MKVDRKQLYSTLLQVTPGLDSKEVLEQSNSFIFKNGYVYSFNDEISVRSKIDVGFEGIVPAPRLIQLLGKMSEDEIDITLKDSVLYIKGKGKKAQITIQRDVILPIDEVEIPKKFKEEVPGEFQEALVGSTLTCCRDLTSPKLTCVHVFDGKVESSDNFRGSRYTIPEFGEEFLIPLRVVNQLSKFDVRKIALTDNWVHFRCQGNTVFSFRRILEQYPDLDKAGLFRQKGTKFKIPEELNEALSRTGIFSKAEFEQDETVMVSIQKGKIKVQASCETASYEEVLSCTVKTKEDLSFEIHPKFLQECGKNTTAYVNENALSIKSGNFQYVALLTIREDYDEED